MNSNEMIALGEAVAINAVGEGLSRMANAADAARLTVLVAHQLTAIAQVLCENAALDFVAIYREELERAGRWHDDITRRMDQREGRREHA